MAWYLLKECLGNTKFAELRVFEGGQSEMQAEIISAKADKPDGRFLAEEIEAPVFDEAPAKRSRRKD